MSGVNRSDLPVLRALRDAYRHLLDALNKQKAVEADVGMLLAYASVQDELQGDFDRVGRQLSRLERSGGRS